MLILRDVNIALDDDNLLQRCADELKTDVDNISALRIIKKSIDARKKSDIHFVYTFELELHNGEKRIAEHCKKAQLSDVRQEETFVPIRDKAKMSPIIVGSGPAGIFCALEMIEYGYAPIIIERGKPVEQRVIDVEAFNKNGILNIESNIQFGEGGAGTFSDGKLNTGINNTFKKKVLETYVKFGADQSILYDAQPHIGTDVLRNIAKNIRNYIIDNGGKFMFSSKLIDVDVNNGVINSAKIQTENGIIALECDTLVLAIGHSARDTFKMLYNKKIPMEQKPFAIGVRIEHLQQDINKGRYGEFYNHPALKAASYNLSARFNDVGVFTFCMCPGGTVVAASSEENSVVTNGMSYHARDGLNANSAVLVGVNAKDFGSNDIFAGLEFQRKIERSAFKCTGSYKAPCQRFADLCNNKTTTAFGDVLPTYTAGVEMVNISHCLPQSVIEHIALSVNKFGQLLPGFDNPDAVLTAPETRSSSPIRIIRGFDMQSSVIGLYPCGEGAGYAGGITSAAVDGIKTARAVLSKI